MGHNNNNNNKRKKNKTFQRPKYHSFVAGQAKKNNKNSNDPLLSVKNTLIHYKLGMMPQSQTQDTPLQTPKILTPRRNSKNNNKMDAAPSLSLIHPVSEPIDDNIESESMSPQDHNELITFKDMIANQTKPPSIADIKGKSF